MSWSQCWARGYPDHTRIAVFGIRYGVLTARNTGPPSGIHTDIYVESQRGSPVLTRCLGHPRRLDFVAVRPENNQK